MAQTTRKAGRASPPRNAGATLYRRQRGDEAAKRRLRGCAVTIPDAVAPFAPLSITIDLWTSSRKKTSPQPSLRRLAVERQGRVMPCCKLHPRVAVVFILNTRSERKLKTWGRARNLPQRRPPCPATGCWSASPSSGGPSAISLAVPTGTRQPSYDGPRAFRRCPAKRPLGWKRWLLSTSPIRHRASAPPLDKSVSDAQTAESTHLKSKPISPSDMTDGIHFRLGLLGLRQGFSATSRTHPRCPSGKTICRNPALGC